MSKKEEQFKSILIGFQDKIYRLCRTYVPSEEDCRDLFQNVLIKIWRNLDSFKGRSSVSTWIFRITINASIDYTRSTRRNKYISICESNDYNLKDETSDIENKIISDEQVKQLYQCINKLSFLDRTLISLYLEELKYKEIADIMGISENNVSVKIARVKKKLSEMLNKSNQ